MAKTPENLIHVFRAGKHVTAAGETIHFSEADVAAIAAAYDPALHEAPFVVGHPKMDDPAYGWAAGFRVEGGDLYAVGDQVNPEFAEMVNAGAFKKRSLKLYRPTDPANPKPGVWYPQHVGFLGARAPAIKGLKAVAFADGGDLVEVEFGAWEDRTVARMFRRLREWMIGQFGQEAADKVIDAYDVDALQEEALREQATEISPAPAFAEASPKEVSVSPEEAAALAAENAALKAEKEARDAADKAAAAGARRAEAVQFCEGLIQAGKLLPAEKDGTVALLLMAVGDAPVEFAEDAGAAGATLRALLTAMPKRVEFGEFAGHDTSVPAVEFAAPAGHGIDAERLDLHQKALAYQAAHSGTDYLAAVKAVS